jgi:hypothetical protein
MMPMGAGRKSRRMEKVEKRYCTALSNNNLPLKPNNGDHACAM